MRRIVEFKVYAGQRWEDTPVSFMLDATGLSFDATDGAANRLAAKVAQDTGKEVRWERQGVGQGHYIHPRFAGRILEEEAL